MRIAVVILSASKLAARKRALLRRSRSVVLCAMAAWLIMQFAVSAAIDRWAPEMRDPEFGHKLARIESGRTFDDAPLIVVCGSSRSDYGICPTAMEHVASGVRAPLVFNFAMMGGGPIMQLSMLRELLARDVRPDGLLVEVNPLLMHQSRGFAEEEWLRPERLDFAGMQVFRRYTSRPWNACWNWLRSRLTPCYSLRFLLLDRFAPHWLEPTVRQDRRTPPDSRGWLPHEPQQVTAEDRLWRIGRQLEQYSVAFNDFAISASPDGALHELLCVCRNERIAAGLLVMPEASEFRTAFGAEATRRFETYVAGLSREFSLPLINARAWVSDQDFADGEHLLPDGARRFSQRLSQSAEPLLAQASRRRMRSLDSAAIRTARLQTQDEPAATRPFSE